MRIVIEKTDTVTSIAGVEVRLREGRTEGGVPCLVYVHRLCVPDVGDNCAQFDRELIAKGGPHSGPPPGLSAAIDLRKVV